MSSSLLVKLLPLAICLATQGATRDGAALVEEMVATVDKWHDYTCSNTLEYYKNSEPERRSCNFFYKDKQVRVEVTDGGYRNGSVVVKHKDGTVRAKGGLMMAFIEMNLDPDSRMLIMPNGVNVGRSDLPELLHDLKRLLDQGLTAKVSNAPVSEPGIQSKVFVMDVFDDGALSRKLLIDPQRHIPLRWDLYRDGKRLSSAWFNNVRSDVGLDDKLFRL
jgi:hypothetical protein